MVLEKPKLIHEYNFQNSCFDSVGGNEYNCKLYGDAMIGNDELILKTDDSYAQFPEGLLNSSVNLSIELFVTTSNDNDGWCRILQFGGYSQNNAESFALDRIANNYNNNNHAHNVMLEYFPRGYYRNDDRGYQAYSVYKFNGQNNLYIVILLSVGNNIILYTNGTKAYSILPIPDLSQPNYGFADIYNYIG